MNIRLAPDLRAELVLDTRHDRAPRSRDGEVVADVDLAVLGSDSDAYDRYAAAVRAEYRWVPRSLYRRGRADVLRGFLARDAVFHTATFRECYEERARENLRRELATLG